MELMITGLFLFFATHAVPSVPRLRLFLTEKIGELPYKAVFSVLSIVGIALVVVGKKQAPFEILWFPDMWWVEGAKMLMLPAFILMAATYIPSDIGKSVKHPMSFAVCLWATAHLIANGDLATTVIFSSFFVYALFSAISGTIRGKENNPENTSFGMNLVVLVVGGVAYALVGLSHEWLFGVSIR